MITVIGNLKGGTGKSTVAFNLGLWLAVRERTVTMIDLDPQATLSEVLSIRQEEGYQPVLQGYAALSALSDSQADETIIDVGPSALETMMEAIRRADRVVIPVPPSQADVWSTERFVGMIDDACGRAKRRPTLHAFINRADTHQAVRESDEASEALSMISQIDVLTPRLAQRMAFRRSFSEALAAFELEPAGKAALELDSLATLLYPSV